MTSDNFYELNQLLDSMKYWEDISECVCNSSSPIGSCLKCDMKNGIALISQLKQECEEYVKIEVPFGTRHPPAFMIEDIFNYLIGPDSMPWIKKWRDRDAATIYEVPKDWEDWWRFWLGVPKLTKKTGSENEQ